MSNKEQTLFSTFLDKLKGKYIPNEKEQRIIDIVEEMCNQSDSDIKMAPLTHRYFIVNKRLEYWIRISEFEVTITNHKFTLNYSGNAKFHTLLQNTVSNSIEQARNEFEETVFQNEVELLDNIKQSLTLKY
jgi:hypothetical protein